MKKYPCLFSIFLSVLLGACAPAYSIYQFDNGDDYYSEGLRRIVDAKGRIGYQDEAGKTVIRPRFAFGFPFNNGVARVTCSGKKTPVGEHWKWESKEWQCVDRRGRLLDLTACADPSEE